jgi:hypothetical protein
VDGTEARLARDIVDGVTPPRGDVESRISHFIPSTRLEGSRKDKVRTLDLLIAHLLDLRRRLAGITDERRGSEWPAWRVGSKWRWFGAGAAMGAASAWLILARVL